LYIKNEAFVLLRRRGLPQISMKSWKVDLIAADLLVRF